MTLGSKGAVRAFAALAAVAVATVGLAACSSNPGPSSSPSASTAQKKNLNIAIPTIQPPYLGTQQGVDALRVTSNIFDPLIFRDPKTGKLTPGLATKWKEVSPTVTDLTIRQGVKFQDGSSMTADDVAFTLSSQRLWGPNALEPTAATLASTFANVEVKNPTTVEITTKQPDPAILNRLASIIGYVVPKDYELKVGVQGFGVKPIGTGPYEVESLTPGQKVVLKANPDYWGPKPDHQTITFNAVSDVTARVSGLASGQYDIATTIPPDQTEQVKGNGQSIDSVKVNNLVSLAFMTNQTGQPTSDPKVRQAMLLAIDRQAVAKSLWNGQVDVHDGFNVPAFDGFYDSKIPVVKQDTKKAKALLDSAGYKGQAIDLQYITGLYTNVDQALQAMLPMWKKAGLNVTLDPVANFTLLNYNKLQVYATSSNFQLGDPISPIYTDWLSPTSNPVKQGRYTPSAAMAAAGQTLATSTSDADRTKAFDTIAKLWTTEVPAISLWQPVENYGVAKGVSFTPDPRYYMRFAPIPTK